MKIEINSVKVAPKSVSKDFMFCVYGNLTPEIKEWVEYHKLKTEITEKYTNIFLNDDTQLKDLFNTFEHFEYLDGFSPNLNKQLHIGHFSNLVIGKAFSKLGITKKVVSIYGDTLEGNITKSDALTQLDYYKSIFDFPNDETYFASEIKYEGDLLKDGVGMYEGTKIFDIDDTKIVGIKSDGSTSYFYQDVALASKLNSKTLYLTGEEQVNHFNCLKKLFDIEHIGLGLVKISGSKMSSRLGNVILIDDFINLIKDEFENNLELIYNVFAGFILKSNPNVEKKINLDLINNPKNSNGLYISYTMARLFSAGCEYIEKESFVSKELEYAYIKSQIMLKPNLLFDAIVEHCKEINNLYGTHTIKNSVENKNMFETLLSDLIKACKYLGLFIIKKV